MLRDSDQKTSDMSSFLNPKESFHSCRLQAPSNNENVASSGEVKTSFRARSGCLLLKTSDETVYDARGIAVWGIPGT